VLADGSLNVLLIVCMRGHSVTEAYSKKIELIFVDLGLFFNRFTNVLPRDSRL